MKIAVKINGIFNRIFLQKDLSIKIKENDSMEQILKKIGKMVRMDILNIFKEKRSNPILLLNGKRVDLMEQINLKLQDGDELTLLQALGGG